MPKNSNSSHCCLLPVACCLTSARSLLIFLKSQRHVVAAEAEGVGQGYLN
jgi:hypothetical protein